MDGPAPGALADESHHDLTFSCSNTYLDFDLYNSLHSETNQAIVEADAFDAFLSNAIPNEVPALVAQVTPQQEINPADIPAPDNDLELEVPSPRPSQKRSSDEQFPFQFQPKPKFAKRICKTEMEAKKELEISLIENVKQHRILFDKKHPEFLDKEKKDAIWNEISSELGILGTEKEAAELWKSLRQQYVSHQNKPNRNGCYFRHETIMAFYKPFHEMFRKKKNKTGHTEVPDDEGALNTAQLEDPLSLVPIVIQNQECQENWNINPNTLLNVYCQKVFPEMNDLDETQQNEVTEYLAAFITEHFGPLLPHIIEEVKNAKLPAE